MGSKRANGEGSIYQLPNGRWRATLSYTDENGKLCRSSKKTKTQADARAALDNLKKKVGIDAAPQVAPQIAKSVSTFLDEWIDTLEGQELAENTVKSYTHAINKHVKPQIGQLKLQELNAKRIEQMFSDLKRLKTGARTRQNIYTVLNAALNKAELWDDIVVNPCRKVAKPSASRKEIVPFTAKESQKILDLVTGEPHEAFYRLALTTGMRQGEMFGLHWDAIDFKEKTLLVYQQATEVWGALRVKKPKTQLSIRTLHLTDGVVAALLHHKEKQAKSKPANSNIVFPNQDGTYFRRGTFSKWSWTPLLKKAKLKHRGLHHTRHTVATIMLAEGFEIAVVAKILGDTPEVVQKTYAHLVPGRDKSASDKIGQIMDKSQLRPGCAPQVEKPTSGKKKKPQNP